VLKFDQVAIPTSNPKNTTVDWLRVSDTKEVWEDGIKRFGPSWHYANKSFNYTYNSLGYRTKELSEVNDREFFVVYGCSYTEGVGLAEDEIYHYLLSQQLNVPYLNYGCGGSAPSLQLMNTTLFVKNTDKLPKFVLMQWPTDDRCTLPGDSKLDFIGSWTSDKNNASAYDFYKHWIADGRSQNHSLISVYAADLLWKSVGVPVFHFTLHDNKINIPEFRSKEIVKKPPNELSARDIFHPGPNWHLEIANWLLNKIPTL
jgi:hypothetical protein